MKSCISTVFFSVIMFGASSFAQKPNNILHGVVTQDGKPVNGALVSIYLLTPGGYAKTIVSNTNEKGEYFFSQLPKGDYAIIVNNGDARLYQGMTTISDRLDNTRNVPESTPTNPKVKQTTLNRGQPAIAPAAQRNDPFAPKLQPGLDSAIQGDLFVGKWKLNLASSKIPSWMHITDEIRTYSREGNVIRMTLERVHQDSSKITYDRKITCDGKPVAIDKQITSCQFVAPNIIEGQSSPPLQYQRSEVSNGQLKIGITKDTKRVKPDEKYVYDKIQ